MYISTGEAIQELENGGIVAIPTETVYGLGGNALNETAVRKIFELKNRPLSNPLIIHLSSAGELPKVAREIPQAAYELAERFWPGPLTLVLRKQDAVPDIVTAGLDTVGVRVPDHKVTLELLKRLSFPLAAPSANPFGSISPTKPDHILNYFGNELSILPGGECERGIESTIVGFDESQHPVLYRYGSISAEEIRQVIGDIKLILHKEAQPNAPGMLPKHYSPKSKSYLALDVCDTLKTFSGKKVGLLLFKKRINLGPEIDQEILSQRGDFKEAAKNLYAAMHRLDAKNPDVIIFEQLPEEGLGITINDKLRRATQD